MKLITNFRDYYDSVAAQDRDTSTMWTRNKFDKCEFPHEEVNGSNRWKLVSKENSRLVPADCAAGFMVIGFAGKLYPLRYVAAQTQWSYRKMCTEVVVPSKVIFDEDIICRRWNSWRKKYFIDEKTKQYLEYIKQPNVVSTMFQLWGGQFLLKSLSNYTQRPAVWTVPTLGDWGFVKILPPHMAWQAICQWQNNQAGPDKYIPTMSNDIKIQQAGFNLKTSFRKGKSK